MIERYLSKTYIHISFQMTNRLNHVATQPTTITCNSRCRVGEAYKQNCYINAMSTSNK